MSVQLIVHPILPDPRDYPMNITKAIDSAIYQVLNNKVKPRVKRAMANRVKDWKVRPQMGSRYSRPAIDRFELDVFPTGSDRIVSIWKYVSRGTKKDYPITAVHAPMLRIREDYKARTDSKGKYGIAGGGQFYGGTYQTYEVTHPGIEARQFEENVLKDESNKIIRDIQLAINLAVRS